MFRLQSEQVDANPNSFGFQYGSLEYQNLQCENSIHVNRKHCVTQNNQGDTMHYTLKDHQGSLTTAVVKQFPVSVSPSPVSHTILRRTCVS